MCVSVVLSVLCAVIILFCNKNIAVARYLNSGKKGRRAAECKLLQVRDERHSITITITLSTTAITIAITTATITIAMTTIIIIIAIITTAITTAIITTVTENNNYYSVTVELYCSSFAQHRSN